MIDRERLLAADHEASLQAEARLRRLAAQAAASPTMLGTSRRARVRIALGQWLIGTGRRLDRGLYQRPSSARSSALARARMTRSASASVIETARNVGVRTSFLPLQARIWR